MKKEVIGAIFILLLMAMPISLPACQKAQPEFEVVYLDIAPREVSIDETVTLSAEIRNSGDSEGTYDATLLIDGAEAETKSVTLSPGATEVVTFTLARDKSGYYEIAVGNRSMTLAVQESSPPVFHISELAINPAEVDPGEKMTITAKVANDGGTEGTYAAKLQINDFLEQVVNITIAAGMNQTVTFSISKDMPGTYTASLGKLSKQFWVSWPDELIQPVAPPKPPPGPIDCPSCQK